MIPEVTDKLILINTATHDRRITIFSDRHTVQCTDIDLNAIVDRRQSCGGSMTSVDRKERYIVDVRESDLLAPVSSFEFFTRES